jgi:hypothetical protein
MNRKIGVSPFLVFFLSFFFIFFSLFVGFRKRLCIYHDIYICYPGIVLQEEIQSIFEITHHGGTEPAH